MIHLLEIESLSAFALGCYGEHRYQTPTFDAIASQSYVCNEFYHANGPLLAESEPTSQQVTCYRWSPPELKLEALIQAAQAWLDDDVLESILNEMTEEISAAAFLNALAPKVNSETFKLIQSTATTIRYDAKLLSFFEELELDDGDLLIIAGVSGDRGRQPRESENEYAAFSSTQFHLPLIIFFESQSEHHRIFEYVQASDLQRLCTQFAERADAFNPQEMERWTDSLSDEKVRLQTPFGTLIRTPKWLLIDQRNAVPVGEDSLANCDREQDLLLFQKPEDLWENLNVAPQYPDLIERYLATGELQNIADEHNEIEEI